MKSKKKKRPLSQLMVLLLPIVDWIGATGDFMFAFFKLMRWTGWLRRQPLSLRHGMGEKTPCRGQGNGVLQLVSRLNQEEEREQEKEPNRQWVWSHQAFICSHSGFTLEMRNRSHPLKPHKCLISMKHMEIQEEGTVKWEGKVVLKVVAHFWALSWKSKAFNMNDWHRKLHEYPFPLSPLQKNGCSDLLKAQHVALFMHEVF